MKNFNLFDVLCLSCMAIITLLTGCQRAGSGAGIGPVRIDAERGHVWQVCQDELRQRGFRLNRVDEREGIIETCPQVSGQWFEVWKNDIVTPAARAAASVHTVRRYVLVHLKATREASVAVECEVYVERLAFLPEEWYGAVRAEDVLREQVRRAHMRNVFYENSQQQMHWIPAGEDRELAGEIYHGIIMGL